MYQTQVILCIGSQGNCTAVQLKGIFACSSATPFFVSPHPQTTNVTYNSFVSSVTLVSANMKMCT